MAGDARTLDLGGDFDALVGRFVLMYMSDPSEALKQFAGCLRPGGIVAFQEIDFMFRRSFHPPNTPLAKKLIGWLSQCLSVRVRIPVWLRPVSCFRRCRFA